MNFELPPKVGVAIVAMIALVSAVFIGGQLSAAYTGPLGARIAVGGALALAFAILSILYLD